MVKPILPPLRGADAEEAAALFLELVEAEGAQELGLARTFAHAVATLDLYFDYAADWDARQAIRRRARQQDAA